MLLFGRRIGHRNGEFLRGGWVCLPTALGFWWFFCLRGALFLCA